MITEKRILVTGGRGFLGRHIVGMLDENNYVFSPSSRNYDLRNSEAAEQIFSDYGPVDIVIHCAADIGGIGYSSSHPADQFYNNTLINLNTVDAAYRANVKKFVAIGSVCEYPAETPIPFREEELWNGYPVETNDSYGLTKRMLGVQCDAYRRQFGFNAIHLLPVNMYGPYDDFSLANSHVIPALIRKIAHAKETGEKTVEVWGTGDESREFVYVADVAKAVVLATEKYDKNTPVNIGSGREIKIKDLADILKKTIAYEGEFEYLDNGLGGQQRRMLDVSKALYEFGFEAETDFETGLIHTVNYYYSNQSILDK